MFSVCFGELAVIPRLPDSELLSSVPAGNNALPHPRDSLSLRLVLRRITNIRTTVMYVPRPRCIAAIQRHNRLMLCPYTKSLLQEYIGYEHRSEGRDL